MQFLAKARYIRVSPFKLRPLVDVVRGKNVEYALHVLASFPTRRTVEIKKLVESATANAKNLANVEASNLMIKEIKVDQGPAMRYYKPGAMGRSGLQRKRFSHVSVVLEQIDRKEA
jgi:large subunit ribosomal protein L22